MKDKHQAHGLSSYSLSQLPLHGAFGLSSRSLSDPMSELSLNTFTWEALSLLSHWGSLSIQMHISTALGKEPENSGCIQIQGLPGTDEPTTEYAFFFRSNKLRRLCGEGVYAYVFMCVLTSVEARVQQHTSPSVILHLLRFFLDSLLLSLELTNPAMLPCQNPTVSCLCLPSTDSIGKCHHTQHLLHRCWEFKPRSSFLHGRHLVYQDSLSPSSIFTIL